MTIYYVATLSRYVLVEADDEEAARGLGKAGLAELYPADSTAPTIRLVRPATIDEVTTWRWHEQMPAAFNSPSR